MNYRLLTKQDRLPNTASDKYADRKNHFEHYIFDAYEEYVFSTSSEQENDNTGEITRKTNRFKMKFRT